MARNIFFLLYLLMVNLNEQMRVVELRVQYCLDHHPIRPSPQHISISRHISCINFNPQNNSILWKRPLHSPTRSFSKIYFVKICLFKLFTPYLNLLTINHLVIIVTDWHQFTADHLLVPLPPNPLPSSPLGGRSHLCAHMVNP